MLDKISEKNKYPKMLDKISENLDVCLRKGWVMKLTRSK